LSLILLPATLLAARQPVPIETAAKAPESRGPSSVAWHRAGTHFAWKERDKLLVYDVGLKKEREVVGYTALRQAASTPPKSEVSGWVNRGVKEQQVQWFPTGARLLVAADGDLFAVDAQSGEWEQLTKSAEAEADPKLSPDGRWVSFRRGHDLHVLDVRSKKVTRLTNDGTATRRNAELDWVYPEELAIPTAHWWSPDSRRIAYLQFDTSGLMVYPHADILNLRPFAEPQRYPQAGTANSVVRLGVVAASGGKTRWLDPPGSGEQLIARVTWMADSAEIAVHLLSRVQDRLEVAVIPASGGRARSVVSERSNTWINLRDDFAFLPDEKLLWGSEAGSGYRHLSVRTGESAKPITGGEWEVTDLVCTDAKGGRVYYLSAELDVRERHLYSIGLDGSGKRRLTEARGTHAISMTPDCGSYIDSWSSLTEPPRKSLHDSNGKQIAMLTQPDTSIASTFELLPTEWVDFRGADGTLFHARLIKPAGFSPGKKYPAVVMVYGGPHSQTVRNQWRGADWDQALAHRGFVIWQMDNRGSAGRGHVFEKQLYRRFGKQELADQVEGVKHLVSLGFVDPARVGVYGWSYGGYMTLNSLFNAPDVFAAGVSGAPVTDWRQYDTIYTERYMGLPSENEEGYRASSVVHQAERLKGKLMLVHNFEDDNVLFQHTMRMIDALQKAGKQFELMLYPQKAHSVTGGVKRQMLELCEPETSLTSVPVGG